MVGTFQDAVVALKADLSESVNALFEKFSRENGVMPCGLDIAFSEVTTYGDATKQFVVVGINVRFNL